MSDDEIDESMEPILLVQTSAVALRTLSITMEIAEGLESSIGDTNLSGRNKQRRIHIEINREQGDTDLLEDYLIEIATYTDEQFQRRFGVTKTIFNRLCSSAKADDSFLPQTGCNWTSRPQHRAKVGCFFASSGLWRSF
jgi:hypothetical protein